jgi:hypothetical protein
VLPSVHEGFEFRVLRQNRRVTADPSRAQELEDFHHVLGDVSEGRPSDAVRRFLVQAYVRGTADGCAEKAAVEDCTAIFTKRRYRDRWNRTVVRRIGKVHNHFLKIHGRVRARGARGQQWFSEARTAQLRRKARCQSAWNLHLAGDWHGDLETMALPPRPHLMRCMLIANLAVDQRFANGTQGRLLSWTPASVETGRALSAGHPERHARFAKESSMSLPSLLPEVDFLDLNVRQETIGNVQGQPVLLQLPLVPCYALTTHKTQALSLRHRVDGSLEGVFSTGQVYVLISRVTDPANFCLVGVPPCDMVNEVHEAIGAAGLDAEAWLSMAVTVTGEWVLGPGAAPLDRLVPRVVSERFSPIRLRSLAEVLDPQPEAKRVYADLLDWIERADRSSQLGQPRPPFTTAAGEDIFPEEEWWLTVHQRLAREAQEQAEQQQQQGDEDGPLSEEEEADDHLATDSDPMSDGSGEEADRAGLGRAPDLAWRRGAPQQRRPPPSPPLPSAPPPRPVYPGYFEKQREALCGLHALNNCLGCDFASTADLEAALQELLRTLRQEGVPEVRAQHTAIGGWYSIEVLAQAVTQTSMAKRDRVDYVLSLEPLCVNPSSIRSSVGAIVNVDNRHWVALRWVQGSVWLLDSMDEPRQLTWNGYVYFVRLNRNAFRIDYA